MKRLLCLLLCLLLLTGCGSTPAPETTVPTTVPATTAAPETTEAPAEVPVEAPAAQPHPLEAHLPADWAGRYVLQEADGEVRLYCSAAYGKGEPMDGWLFTLTTLRDFAFFFCTGLTEITLPNSITECGSSVFSSCFCTVN